MIILGIDPALTNLGWGVVRKETTKLTYINSGVIKTNSKDALHIRLAFITACLEKVILEHKPNAVALEETFVNMNNLTSLKLGYARGAIMALIGKHNIDFREFTPNTVKKTVTGYGHAEKHQILHMIKLLLPGTSLIKVPEKTLTMKQNITNIFTRIDKLSGAEVQTLRGIIKALGFSYFI